METTIIHEQFEDDSFEGNVTFITKEFIYVGQILDSKFQGGGMIQFNNGNKYIGDFHRGEYHGKGKLFKKVPIEISYDGYFENGKMNGEFRIENFTDDSVEVCRYELGVKEGDFSVTKKESSAKGFYKKGEIYGDLFLKIKDKELVYTKRNGKLIQKNRCYYLVIDTETTGLYSSIENPRLVQLAYIGYNYFKEKIIEGDFKIKPDRFEIPVSASKIHGISTEDARQNGVDLFIALKNLQQVLENTDLIIGHNIDFDIRILRDEFNRIKLETSLSKIKLKCTESYGREYLEELRKRVVVDYDEEDLDYPISLKNLYNLLYKKDFNKTHNAYNDAKATFECFEAINDGFKFIQELDDESDLDYFANLRD